MVIQCDSYLIFCSSPPLSSALKRSSSEHLQAEDSLQYGEIGRSSHPDLR